jgi:hypothetical protein
MAQQPIVLLALAVVVGILASVLLLFGLVHWVMGALSGWHGLARAYGCAPPEGVWTVLADSGGVGRVRYYHCMRAGVRAEGLYLAVKGLLLHKPLLIPWSEVRHPRRTEIYGWPCYAFDAGEPSMCEVVVSGELYRQMYPFLAGREVRKVFRTGAA